MSQAKRSEVKQHAHGAFCWTDLGTTNAEGAKRFYTALFGWGVEEISMGPGMSYSKLQLDSKDVAALYPLSDEQKAQGITPHWLAYVSVTSADDIAKKAEALGGKVVRAAFDVFDVGRMTLLQDPTGAMVAAWQPRKHIGAQLVGQPNTLCWAELATTDSDVAGQFYTRLFDWGTKTSEDYGMKYTEFIAGGKPTGGMMQMTAEWGSIPPHWMVYFAAEDCDASASKAQSLGGQIKVPATDIPKVGRFAVLQDPQGAVFSIIKLTNPAQ
ncbi:MAG: VOC family protein [Acidobacteria bacterium]|nr:VOC family protein [Acidobacteriota bacterium]